MNVYWPRHTHTLTKGPENGEDDPLTRRTHQTHGRKEDVTFFICSPSVIGAPLDFSIGSDWFRNLSSVYILCFGRRIRLICLFFAGPLYVLSREWIRDRGLDCLRSVSLHKIFVAARLLHLKRSPRVYWFSSSVLVY